MTRSQQIDQKKLIGQAIREAQCRVDDYIATCQNCQDDVELNEAMTIKRKLEKIFVRGNHG